MDGRHAPGGDLVKQSVAPHYPRPTCGLMVGAYHAKTGRYSNRNGRHGIRLAGSSLVAVSALANRDDATRTAPLSNADRPVRKCSAVKSGQRIEGRRPGWGRPDA